MKSKEEGHQFGVTDFRRVIFDLDGFSMTGVPGTDLLVSRMILMSPHVTGDGVDDTIEGRKAILHSPESASTEIRGCKALLGIGRYLWHERNLHILRDKIERSRIQAVTNPCRWRSIRKDVTQMGIATGTADFHTDHTVGIIRFFRHVIPVKSIEEGWPTGSRIKLVIRSKEWQGTDDTAVGPALFLRKKPTAKRGFRPGFLGDMVLLRSQGIDPFLKEIGRQGIQRKATG